MPTIKIRSDSYKSLLLLNWYLLGMEMNLGHNVSGTF